MKCSEFESQISEYLDGELPHGDGARFREHALACRSCRSLLDQVGSTVAECRTSEPLDTPAQLDAVLQSIPLTETPFDCEAYQNLITEFLDGFVPAVTYHRFEEHAKDCDDCAALLTEVVYAVAACHSVHTYEEYDLPGELVDKLTLIAPLRRRSLSQAFADRVRAFVDALIPSSVPGAARSFAMGLFLLLFTVVSLLLGFSQDRTIGGIYRQAQVTATEFYARGARAYSQKERVATKFEEVKSDIGELWEALGGDDEPQAGATAPAGRPTPPPQQQKR